MELNECDSSKETWRLNECDSNKETWRLNECDSSKETWRLNECDSSKETWRLNECDSSKETWRLNECDSSKETWRLNECDSSKETWRLNECDSSKETWRLNECDSSKETWRGWNISFKLILKGTIAELFFCSYKTKTISRGSLPPLVWINRFRDNGWDVIIVGLFTHFEMGRVHTMSFHRRKILSTYSYLAIPSAMLDL